MKTIENTINTYVIIETHSQLVILKIEQIFKVQSYLKKSTKFKLEI